MKFNFLKNKTFWEHILVLTSFLILSIIFTYPIISNVTTHSAGDGGDGLQFIWNIWHVKNTLSEGGGISDLYRTSFQFYPEGTSLVFHTLSLTNTLFISFPLTFLTNNLILIYNILFFLSFILAGYGMYLLIKYLIKDKWVAFIVGFAYTFSPFHLARGLGHLNLMSIQWTPFFILFFIKIFDEKKVRNSIIAAIFLFLSSLSSWYHLLYAFLIAFPYSIYRVIKRPKIINKKFIFRMILFVILFLTILFPFVNPMLLEYFEGDGHQFTGGVSSIHYYSYLLPNFLHSLWGESIQFLVNFNLAEDTVSLSYLVLILSLIYLIKTKNQKFWALLVLLFFILSIYPNSFLLKIILKILPFYRVIYNTSRFSFGVLFSMMIIFGYSLNYFIQKWIRWGENYFKLNKKLLKKLLCLIILIIISIEYIPIPYPSFYGYEQEINQISFFNEKDLNVEDVTILNLPLSLNSKYLYFQTYHEKPIIGGYISRSKLTPSLNKIQGCINSRDVEGFYEILKKQNIGYLVDYEPRGCWGHYCGINEEDLDYLLNNTPTKKISEGEFYYATIYKVL